ncbi:MAG: class I SAM-dependent methyltransferase [Ferruginibacter sp.]
MTINLLNPFTKNKLLREPDGLRDAEGNFFPLKNGAYRMVEDDNYTGNFGFQWNKFAGTQVDKESNLEISKVRFFAETGWENEDLSNKNILEVGSGAGRFSQIILDFTKATLYSVDFSNAVEANYKNNGPNDRLNLFQASIYEMPFEKEQFDKVLCIGVLQHTPDFESSVKALIEMAKPGAEVIVDFYGVNGWWTKFHSKYMFRPITKKMSHEKLHKTIDRNIDWLIKASTFFSKIGIGNMINRFLPICDIDGTMPKNIPYKKLRELCVLDTFDMFSPEHDHPQKIETVVKWFEKYGMYKVWGGKVQYENCVASIVKGIKK